MTHSDNIIFVTGATGQQGGAVARHLLADGWRVRAFVRNPEKLAAQALAKAGGEIFQGDNDDRASLDAAMQGVYGVFSIQSFFEGGTAGETRQGKNVANAASVAGVQHFVYSSVGGAERDSGVPHFESKWQVEQHIRQLGLPATIIRPVEFMENFFWGQDHILSGTLMSQGLRPTRVKQFIAVDDIGAFATIAFANPHEYIDKAFELAGDGLTEQQIADTLSRVIGRPVNLLRLPHEQLEASLDPYMREELLKMWQWFDESGYNADINALRRIYQPLKTLESWLHETGWAANQPAATG
ncbi:MAG: NmrA/HSCARG family protein [Chloroflexi bacterium]|nr:NmrA/HSCARG family protein [Chloroflexota bacterium]